MFLDHLQNTSLFISAIQPVHNHKNMSPHIFCCQEQSPLVGLFLNIRCSKEVFNVLYHCRKKATEVLPVFSKGTPYRYTDPEHSVKQRGLTWVWGQKFKLHWVVFMSVCVSGGYSTDKCCDFEKGTRKYLVLLPAVLFLRKGKITL